MPITIGFVPYPPGQAAAKKSISSAPYVQPQGNVAQRALSVTLQAVPNLPKSVAIASLTGSSITVTWTGDPIATSFIVTIYSSSSSSMTSPTQVTQSTVSGSGQAISSTAINSLYYGATVQARNQNGASRVTDISTGSLYTAPPVAPTSITTGTVSASGATITWSGGSGATSYTVQIYSSASSNMSSRSTVSQSPSSSTSVTSPQAFTFTATGGLYYAAIVTAINAGGSTASAISTGIYFSSVPVAPTTVTLSSLSAGGASVTWSGGSGATSYTCQIYYSSSSDMSSRSTATQSPSSSTSVSSGQSFSFSAQDSLYYAAIVTAVSSGGSSSSSISTGVQFVGTYAGTASVGTVATTSSAGRLYGLAVDSGGNVYAADYTGFKVWYFPAGGSPSVFAGTGVKGYTDGAIGSSQFNGVGGVAVNAAGTIVYVADYGNCCIRMITNGTVSTLTGFASTAGQSGIGTGGYVDGSSSVAKFWYPYGIALDTTETLLFIGDYATHRIRVVTISTGAVSTLAGGLNSTVAGAGSYSDGTGSGAAFYNPRGVCVDVNNNVYVADTGNQRIRKVTYPGGVVTTVAGTGSAAYTNATGTSAAFSSAQGVAVDSYGIIYVADSGNRRVRQITGAGVVTTFAGSGALGSADNSNPLLATFPTVSDVVVGPSRTLYVCQYNTSTPAQNGVRIITLA